MPTRMSRKKKKALLEKYCPGRIADLYKLNKEEVIEIILPKMKSLNEVQALWAYVVGTKSEKTVSDKREALSVEFKKYLKTWRITDLKNLWASELDTMESDMAEEELKSRGVPRSSDPGGRLVQALTALVYSE